MSRVEERETSLALLRPGAGLKQDFEVGVKSLLPWNKDPHFVGEGSGAEKAARGEVSSPH